MTPRQHELLCFIRESIAKNGFSPSYEEMRVAMGLASKSGIHRLIEGLEERGHITRIPNRNREITVVGWRCSWMHASTADLRAELAARDANARREGMV